MHGNRSAWDSQSLPGIRCVRRLGIRGATFDGNLRMSWRGWSTERCTQRDATDTERKKQGWNTGRAPEAILKQSQTIYEQGQSRVSPNVRALSEKWVWVHTLHIGLRNAPYRRLRHERIRDGWLRIFNRHCLPEDASLSREQIPPIGNTIWSVQ